MYRRVGNEHKRIDTTFCRESKCQYYFGEIDECMKGEDGVPDDMEEKCTIAGVVLPVIEEKINSNIEKVLERAKKTTV